VTERRIATHAEPARRDEANFIVRLDLTEHGMAGAYEQMWARTKDQESFELCCIPFFTYGQSIGDVLEVAAGTGQHRVLAKCGHRTIRFSFTDDRQAHEQHQVLHDALAGGLGCRVEFHGVRYGAIDLSPDVSADAVIDVLTPHHDAGYLIWEWADPRSPAIE
jgi:Domain of unknown function (DUF4265)